MENLVFLHWCEDRKFEASLDYLDFNSENQSKMALRVKMLGAKLDDLSSIPRPTLFWKGRTSSSCLLTSTCLSVQKNTEVVKNFL